jgi:hypothetical protein
LDKAHSHRVANRYSEWTLDEFLIGSVGTHSGPTEPDVIPSIGNLGQKRCRLGLLRSLPLGPSVATLFVADGVTNQTEDEEHTEGED